MPQDGFNALLNEMFDKQNRKGGFFDLPKDKRCTSLEHNAPAYMVIPPGKGYRHVCPKCGAVQTIIPAQISF